jgi:hypothetical protein
MVERIGPGMVSKEAGPAVVRFDHIVKPRHGKSSQGTSVVAVLMRWVLKSRHFKSSQATSSQGTSAVAVLMR